MLRCGSFGVAVTNAATPAIVGRPAFGCAVNVTWPNYPKPQFSVVSAVSDYHEKFEEWIKCDLVDQCRSSSHRHHDEIAGCWDKPAPKSTQSGDHLHRTEPTAIL